MRRTNASCAAARLFAAAVVCACAALTLAGCRKGKSGQFVPRYGKDRQDSVYIAGHYTNFEALEAEFDRFKEYYPSVELRYEGLDNYNASIIPAVRGEDPPDIYFTFIWMLDKPAYRPLFEDAENLAQPQLEFDLDCIQKGSVIQGKESGRVLMLPIVSNSYGMLVNEDLFKKHGLKIPRDYESLKQTIGKLRDLGFSSPVIGEVNGESGVFTALAIPYFCSLASGDSGVVEKLNGMGPDAAPYVRDLLDFVGDFLLTGAVDLDACAPLKSGNDIIFRFFEGDIPMVFCVGDVVSSTKKRERISEPFMKAPFSYRFYPIPTDRGRIFLKNSSLELSVNRNSRNLEMANEFMRFLICPSELDNLAQQKRLMTVTTDYLADDIYSAFGEADVSINYDNLGLMDNTMTQMRRAVNAVAKGKLSRDEAVAAFGSF